MPLDAGVSRHRLPAAWPDEGRGAPRRCLGLVTAALGLILSACGDERDLVDVDRTSPVVTIEQPQEDDTVGISTPYAVRVSNPDGEDVLCSSISVTIGSLDFSSLFRSGCRPFSGEVRVGSGEILLRDGDYVLVFMVSDLAGNLATGRRRFTVRSSGPAR